MTGSKHSRTEILAVLQQAQDSRNVAEICEHHSISIATFYRWRRDFGHLLPSGGSRPSSGLNGST